MNKEIISIFLIASIGGLLWVQSYHNKTNIRLDENAGEYHVYPGGNIQEALEVAARDANNKVIVVHTGTYRPNSAGQALLWFNSRHDGITLEADGEVILTAENPDIADPDAPSYPAIVNHIVYFGDGISRSTIFRGFKITGAKDFVTHAGSIEPSSILEKGLFFYGDGGAMKIFGRSYPTIENVEIYGNSSSICGGGVSVEHGGYDNESVLFKNCIFRNNTTRITGAAIDLLPGSSAVIENCLFVGNVSNTGTNFVGPYNEEHGSGALTVFFDSRATVRNSTFTGNWAGVDDKGFGNIYENNIFWNNNKSGGTSRGARYEIDILDGKNVKGNFISGKINDLRGTINNAVNVFDPPPPDFDNNFVSRAPEYDHVGYRGE